MNTDGSGFVRLTNDPFIDRVPRWTADGSAILFFSNRNGRFSLWSIRPDGTALAERDSGHITPEMLSSSTPAPAGSVVPPDLLSPRWSPDQHYVAGWLPATLDGHRPFVIGSAAGTNEWRVGDRVVHPIWLRDSTGLLYYQDNEIRFADMRSRSVHRVYSHPGVDIHANFTLAPDEKTLYLVQMEDEEDVWVAEP
jgi:hypothetical protein